MLYVPNLSWDGDGLAGLLACWSAGAFSVSYNSKDVRCVVERRIRQSESESESQSERACRTCTCLQCTVSVVIRKKGP